MIRILIISLILLITSDLYAQKLQSADYHIHRNSLTNSFRKFQEEKIGRVAFLGGSITYNPGWRDSVCAYLQQKFPDTEFEFIAAGIPSMGSTPGAFRFSRDVLKNGPVDLLFEEAAVNDDTNMRGEDEVIRAMEGIVRHAKSANKMCDVVFMYFVDPGKMEHYRNGEIPDEIQWHEKVAQHYSVSAINLAKEVTERIDAGEFDWENDFKDLHPSPFGQGVYARSIIQFLEDELELYANVDANVDILPEPLDNFCYEMGKLVQPGPRKSIKGWTMIDNWKPDNDAGTRDGYVHVPMLVGEYPGQIIKFRFKGTAVGIAVAAGPNAGVIEYSVDNAPWRKFDLFTEWSKNLYLPWYCTLENDLKNRNHTLQIRLAKDQNPESTGRKCILRHFFYNGN